MSNLPFLGLVVACCVLGPPGPAAGLAAQRPAEARRFEKTEPHMGVAARIVLYAENPRQAERAFGAAFSRIAELDRVLSTYRPDSEVSCLARAPAGAMHRASADLWDVLVASRRISRQTEGAFDATLQPTIELWRQTRRRGELPEESKLRDALKRTGMDKLVLDPADRSVTFQVSGMGLNFGGIGKGFAADEALAVLAGHGVDAALVELGGDLALGAPPPGRDGWRVAVRPALGSEQAHRFVTLSRCGVATSGDGVQFVEIGGKRYSHILDPATGLGVRGRRAATAVASSAATADAWASAACVLLPGRSIELAARNGVQVLVQQLTGARVKHWQSGDFPPLQRVEKDR